jgi:hypothetical protein
VYWALELLVYEALKLDAHVCLTSV